MDPRILRDAQAREPFVPFRIHLRDGRAVPVARADLMLVCNMTTVVGLLCRPADRFFHAPAFVHNPDLTRLEPLAGAAD